MDTLYTLAFSSISSLIARTTFYPLDTIKTRIQHAKAYKPTTWNPFKLYQGLGVTLLFSVPASAVYLTTYDTVKEYRDNSDSFITHTVAAISAEGIAGILFTPMEVLKQKLQVLEAKKDTMSMLRDTYNKFGIRGFYKGYFLGQAVFIPYTITYFVTYEQLKLKWKSSFDPSTQTLPIGMYVTCSSIAGALAGAISNPLDVIKTRVQIASNKDTKQVIQQLYRENGIHGFAKGMGARIFWIAPSMSLSITIFELLKDWNKS
jgi:hypothetical protein